MNRKLWISALYTSPIIALYGVGSFYVFKVIDLTMFIHMSLRVSVMLMLLWCIHIYLELRYPKLNDVFRFVIAYGVALIIKLILPSRSTSPVSEIIFKNTSYFLSLSFLPNLIIMIICRNIASKYRKAEADMEIQQLKLKHSEAQKQVLAKQLQPHFLFNALGVLKSLITTDQQMAEEYTVKLSHFLQYSIKAQENDLVLLRTELEFASDYIALQKMRFGDAFNAKIDIDPSLLEKKIPVFALHALLENIFKHNQFTEKKPLIFSISSTGNTIEVSNTKNPAKNVLQNHTGLSNLNGRYQLIAGLEITVLATDDQFIVQLPILDR